MTSFKVRVLLQVRNMDEGEQIMQQQFGELEAEDGLEDTELSELLCHLSVSCQNYLNKVTNDKALSTSNNQRKKPFVCWKCDRRFDDETQLEFHYSSYNECNPQNPSNWDTPLSEGFKKWACKRGEKEAK